MKALILSTNKDIMAVVRRACNDHQPVIDIVQTIPSMQAEGGINALYTPDLVIVDANSYPRKEIELLKSLAQKYPKCLPMLLTSDKSSEMLIQAMRTGVREVIALPVEESELKAALNRTTKKVEITDKNEGKLFSFLSCKGGSGTTFLASNLSYGLSALSHKRVLLIDLNQQFGDAALYVSDLKSPLSLSEICSTVDRVDGSLLETSALRVTPNFSILAASDQIENSSDIRVDQFSHLLQVARRHYDFTIMDLGRQINPVNVSALDASDSIYPIFQQSLPYLRNGRRLFDIFSTLGYEKEKIQLVLNRYDSSFSLASGEFERVLEQRVVHKIPNSHEIVNDSINQGVPVLQMARGSVISKNLVEWVNSLVTINTVPSASLIRRIFDRHSALTAAFR